MLLLLLHLMPRYDAPMLCRLAEQLVVPEPGSALQQLRRCRRHDGVPQNVVESRRQPPRAERVEQDLGRVFALVAVVFVPSSASKTKKRPAAAV